MDEDDRRRSTPGIPKGNLLYFGSIGMELAGGIVGLTLLGWWIDSRYGTAPVWAIVGAALGIIGGGYNFIRKALALSKQARESDRRRP